MSFVNSSLHSLVVSLNTSVLYEKPVSSVIYSKFNLKILLFLASRGYVSFIKIFSRGSGAFIRFKVRTIENGIPAFCKVTAPSVKRGHFFQKQLKFCSSKELLSLYSSEFVVVSTSRGLMTANEAVRLLIGGFVVLVIN